MEQIKNFISENRVAFIVGICILLLVCWLHKDNHRNDGVHNNTDANMASLDRRMQDVESRLNSLSDRIDKTQEAISGVAERVERSRENAEVIADGIGKTESRLDDAVQRSGRISNLIEEIEREHRQRKTDS